MGIEEWRQVYIDGEAWPYEVSSLGRVRRINGQVRSLVLGKNGYLFLSLSKNGKVRICNVHILVCTAFHGSKPDDKQECRHFPDQNKTNNHADNLSWCTYQRQFEDKIIRGTDNRGEKCWRAKLTEDDVLAIRKLAVPYKFLAQQYGVSTGTIADIKTNRTWAWL